MPFQMALYTACSNVKRRLAILYPEKHKLSISERSGIFTSDLIIYLS